MKDIYGFIEFIDPILFPSHLPESLRANGKKQILQLADEYLELSTGARPNE